MFILYEPGYRCIRTRVKCCGNGSPISVVPAVAGRAERSYGAGVLLRRFSQIDRSQIVRDKKGRPVQIDEYVSWVIKFGVSCNVDKPIQKLI